MAGTPNPDDIERAREMARRLVAAGNGQIERVILFGSRARGEAQPRSDFDLLVVESEHRPAFPEEERLTDALGDLGIWAEIRVVSRRSFDLTRDLVGYLSHTAASEGIPLYELEPDERARSAVA